MNILVTAILTTHNRSELLKRSLRSALEQSFLDFEIIVVDDASTDDTYSVLCREFGMELEKGIVTYHKNDERRERGYSRNIGLGLAKGKYIAFLDDDDMWLPEHLKVLVQYLEDNSGVACVFSNSILSYPDGKERIQRLRLKTGSGKYYRDLSVCGQMDSPPLSLFKRDVYSRIGGFRDPPLEDWEYFSRLAMNFEVAYINEVTCIVNIPVQSHLKYPPLEYALKEEEILLRITDNLQMHDYPLSKRMLGGMYFKLAYDIFPDKHKSQSYLLNALKYNNMLVFHGFTWRSFFRKIIGGNTYNMLKRLFLRVLAQARHNNE